MYAITATYTHTTPDGWTSSVQVPTFYLCADVQGIMDEEQATRVARTILHAGVREMPVNDGFSICAVKV